MKVLGIGGEPCTGKSTLMIRFLQRIFDAREKRVELTYKTVRALYCREKKIIVLGVYDACENFPGTDRLSMAVQPDALAFYKSLHKNNETKDGVMVFEGDRLFNDKFLKALTAAGANARWWRLFVEPSTLAYRHNVRCDAQSKTFLKSRKTKLDNLGKNWPIEAYKNQNAADREGLLDKMLAYATDR